MTTIYNVYIEPTEIENRFRISWKNTKPNTNVSFEQEINITVEEKQWLWQMPRHRQIIGEKLFHFLDGEDHLCQQTLENAHRKGVSLQVNLHACKATADWPFETLAKDGGFLLPEKLHLVRCVSDKIEVKGNTVLPKNRPLKLLFMACSVMDTQPELDFEKEEEAIFHITENLAIEMEVEDSGSLPGLHEKLKEQSYDVVHLSGHTGIDKDGIPYFVMEDETGGEHRVSPDQLWSEALIKNPPRLMILSGSRTAETPGLPNNMPLSEAESSFARLLVEKYNVPAVLGWGRKVNDEQAILAGKMIFLELTKGRSIVEAVQRARYELIKAFPNAAKPAWPLLRLYASGIPLNALERKEQPRKPRHRRMTHIYLKNSRVRILEEGFVGRRRQLQRSLRGLKTGAGKVGLLIMGTGGLGKSCLAGKICERFSDHTLIIIQGRLNTLSMAAALKDAFIVARDDKGKRILAQAIEMKDKLIHLCSTCFKERYYLFLLDDFEKNMEGFEKGEPGELFPETADLLGVLLHYLPFSGKKSQVVITSRYEISLKHQEYDIIEKQLEKIWLTGFNKTEQRKKLPALSHISTLGNREIEQQLLAAGHGNPRLMEWIDLLAMQLKVEDAEALAAAVADKQEEFIRKHVIRGLLKKGGASLGRFLRWFSIYRIPVLEEGVSLTAKKAGVKDWKKLLRKGMALSLAEHDQARKSFQVTPLLREELLKGLKDHLPCHKAAFAYFKKVCESRNSIDPVLTEEWIYHALGCGEEEAASRQGGNLVSYLNESLAFQESKKIGEWILFIKKHECSSSDDAFLLNSLAVTLQSLGDHPQAIKCFEQALSIGRSVYGEEHGNVASDLNNLGVLWDDLGQHRKAIEYFEKAFSIDRAVREVEHPFVANRLNNLGFALMNLSDYNEAINYFQQALDIWRNNYGETHTNIACALSSLGSAWQYLGDYHKASEYYDKALSINRLVYGGEEHPNVAKDLNNLGSVFYTLNDHYKAVTYFEEALSIDRMVYGENHPKVGIVLNNLGMAWQASGEIEKAIDYYRQALLIDRLVYGEEHPKVAVDLNNQGLARLKLGETDTAISDFQQALSIWKNVYGEEHPNVAIGLNNLGMAQHASGDIEKAIDYYRKAHAIDRKVYDKEHPNIANGLSNLGAACIEAGYTEEAKGYLEKAYKIFIDIFGPLHPNTKTVKEWLDVCFSILEIDQSEKDFDK